MTKDERLHWLGGFSYGLLLRFAPKKDRLQDLQDLDYWAWEREVKQHDPNLNAHQVREAMAWGKGARKALRIYPPYPDPPYTGVNLA